MNNALKHALREAAGIAGNAARVCIGAPLLPFALPAAVALAAGVAAASATAFGASLATDAGRALLAELRRRARLRAPVPSVPSLRGAPTPDELADDWASSPRTLVVRLRLGSRLADLEPTLDTGNHYKTSPTGAKRIASRGPGFKGWLADRRIPANYGTLMRYKRLAVRLRTLLDLDARLPLEWLLPGAAPQMSLPADLRNQYCTSRRKLSRLLRAHWNFSRLQRHVDEALGIPRLPTLRRLRAAPLDDFLLENTKREFTAFLRSPDLPPRLEGLRCQALSWFP